MNQSKVAHSQGEGKPESERNKGGGGGEERKEMMVKLKKKREMGGWELTSFIK